MQVGSLNALSCEGGDHIGSNRGGAPPRLLPEFRYRSKRGAHCASNVSVDNSSLIVLTSRGPTRRGYNCLYNRIEQYARDLH